MRGRKCHISGTAGQKQDFQNEPREQTKTNELAEAEVMRSCEMTLEISERRTEIIAFET